MLPLDLQLHLLRDVRHGQVDQVADEEGDMLRRRKVVSSHFTFITFYVQYSSVVSHSGLFSEDAFTPELDRLDLKRTLKRLLVHFAHRPDGSEEGVNTETSLDYLGNFQRNEWATIFDPVVRKRIAFT